MIKTGIRVLAVTLALQLAGCDPREDVQQDATLEHRADLLEERAEVVRDQGERTAEGIERSDFGMDAVRTERAADTVRDRSEEKADALEHEAERLRREEP